MKKRICIDIDHVLADLITPWVGKYNEVYNDHLKAEDIDIWDWHLYTKPECGRRVYELLHDAELFETLPVIPHSQDVVKELCKYYEVFTVTASRHLENVPAKGRWLRKNFPFIKKENYVFTVNKSICLADYLVDDKIENLETFQGKKLLFNASHNQDEDRFQRFNNWLELREYFLNESKKQ